MDFSDLIQWCLEHLSYWVILILMILENSLVPLPSELIVTPAAYKAANGEMNIFLVILFTTLGALIGALINYHLALFVGRPIVYKFADSRFGHLLGINRQKIEYVEAFFLKHGKISTFFGRLIPAVRQFISIPAGLARMRLPAFILFTTLGSAIWNSILVLLGYYLAQILPEDRLLEELERYKLCFCGIGNTRPHYLVSEKETKSMSIKPSLHVKKNIRPKHGRTSPGIFSSLRIWR